jgi:hypothetical protein
MRGLWHTDPVTGKEWPVKKLTSEEIQDIHNPSDVKRVWAISRFQRDYEPWEFMDLVDSFIEHNPIGKGVNWSVPMEASLRAMNWLRVYEKTKAGLPESFVERLMESLRQHGWFIFFHPEYSRLRGNHYLANVVALLSLGHFFKNRLWCFIGKTGVEHEATRQVGIDGVTVEKSIAYHLFAQELFTYAATLFKPSGNLSYILERMRIFNGSCRRPDGTYPNWGDDGGDYLFSREQDRGIAFSQFRTSGVYFFTTSNDHIMIDTGELGLFGRGGHGHNDTLSFMWWHDGSEVIVDPGTYSYTGDVAARQMFRSNRYHNTVVIDGKELAPFSSLWTVFEDKTNPRVLKYDGRRLVAEIQNNGLTHRREFYFDGALYISDILPADHSYEWFFHLHPESVIVSSDRTGTSFVNRKHEFRIENNLDLKYKILDTYYSPEYGRRVLSKCLYVSSNGSMNHCISKVR